MIVTSSKKEHTDSCPGLVKVDFYGDGRPTLALVLLSKQNSELVVAHQVGEKWNTTVLGTGGPSAPVVWSLPPGEYTDVNGAKKIRTARPVIVFFEYEAWGILTHGREMQSERFGSPTDCYGLLPGSELYDTRLQRQSDQQNRQYRDDELHLGFREPVLRENSSLVVRNNSVRPDSSPFHALE